VESRYRSGSSKCYYFIFPVASPHCVKHLNENIHNKFFPELASLSSRFPQNASE
jgi:hypothetical protein